MQRIRDLKKNDAVDSPLLVAEKHLNFTREGKPYLRLLLMDRTGSIEGTVWENAAETAATFSQGDVLRVRGMVGTYQQERQIRIQTISPLQPGAYDLREYLPASSRNPDEMGDELHRLIRLIRNSFLRRLLEDIFRDPRIWAAFRSAPAAKTMHHAFLGGLLEHTLSLARLTQLVLRNYPFLDRDLLLAGALLHDLGKSWELAPELGFAYTDEGRLLGHILLGLEAVENKIALIPDFPAPLAMQLKHLLASHHGEQEFGSPKPPMTLEALCLHQLDNLDAKLHGVREYLQSESAGNERWTAFHRVHQRYFYIPESFPRLPSSDEAPGKSSDDSLDLFRDPEED